QIYARFDGTKFVVSWIGVQHASGGGPFSFQILLYPTGEIRYQYKDLHAPLNSATIGMQDQTRGDGLTVAFNSAYVHDNLAVEFKVVPRWLSVSPTDGTVSRGSTMQLQVSFDATGIDDG